MSKKIVKKIVNQNEMVAEANEVMDITPDVQSEVMDITPAYVVPYDIATIAEVAKVTKANVDYQNQRPCHYVGMYLKEHGTASVEELQMHLINTLTAQAQNSKTPGATQGECQAERISTLIWNLMSDVTHGGSVISKRTIGKVVTHYTLEVDNMNERGQNVVSILQQVADYKGNRAPKVVIADALIKIKKASLSKNEAKLLKAQQVLATLQAKVEEENAAKQAKATESVENSNDLTEHGNLYVGSETNSLHA